MRLQRLFEMGPAELAFRGRQEVFKAVERLSSPEYCRTTSCRFERSVLDKGLSELLRRLGDNDDVAPAVEFQHRLQGRMSERFFAGLQDDWNGAQLASRLQGEYGFDVPRLVAQADAVCRSQFEILGYGALSYGNPVDWHLDPLSGREGPLVHWSRLDPLSPSQVGDSKVVWEINRHQWALDLGQAWRLTGDERYAERFVALVSDWLEHNPYGQGINWASALEVAMRLLSWCWALCLFRGAPALTPGRFHTLLGWMQRHAGFVERYQSRYFAPNTHLTVEALALYTIGTLLPELQGAGRWRDLGREILLEQLPLQVSDDGVYFEQSTRYQYYTAEIYLHFAILAARNHDPLPGIVEERLAGLLRFLLEARRPDGSVPQMGDTDGGWLCPLVRRDVGDYRGLFSTAALFLGDARMAWAAGSPTPESFCLLGEQAVSGWESLGVEPPVSPGVKVYDAGGYVIMRSGWEADAHQLIFDGAPLGCHVCGGHGHADLLAVQCSAFGENYLVDPGTGAYTDGSEWREYFRSSRAHSTVRVDGQDQAVTAGPFSWRQRPAVRLLDVRRNPEAAFAAAEHDGYTRLADPVTHRRRVWFIQGKAWLIVDDLVGSTPHRIDLRFQFAPLAVSEQADGWIRARGRNSALLLRTFSIADLAIELVSGASEPLRGWYSPNYGQHVPAPALTLTTSSGTPLRLATLMIPMRDPDGSPPRVEPRVRRDQLAGLTVSGPDLAVPDFGADQGVSRDPARPMS